MTEYLTQKFCKINEVYSRFQIEKLSLVYSDKSILLPQHLEIDNTENPLNLDHFIFKHDENVFELSDELIEMTEAGFQKKIENLSYTNDANLRLSGFEQEADKYIFHTQPVFYETYLRTNLIMDYKKPGKQSLREMYHADGKLEPLEQSVFDNHLGINVLLFTNEGDLILSERSAKVSYAPKKIASSISGAVSVDDVRDGKPLNKRMILREGIEELGLNKSQVEEGNIHFLGLTRELIRGGKPEMFFAATLSISFEEVVSNWQNAADRWESNRLIAVPFGLYAKEPLTRENRKQFERIVTNMFGQYKASMSLPLLTNLALWLKYKMENTS